MQATTLFREVLRSIRREKIDAALICLVVALGCVAVVTAWRVDRLIHQEWLPYQDAERLVWLSEVDGSGDDRLTVGRYRLLGGLTDVFQGTAAFFDRESSVSIQTPAGAQRAAAAVATPDLFSVLRYEHGPVPVLNAPDDESAVASSDLLQRFFGARRLGDLGLRIDGKSRPLVGTVPAGFRFPFAADVWLALDLDEPRIAGSRAPFLRAIGRLRPDVDLTYAQRRIREATQSRSSRGYSFVSARSFRDSVARAPLRQVWAIQLASALVASTAVLNAALLTLAVAGRRRHSLLVRMALGSSVRAAAQPLAAEVAVLFGTGALIGTSLPIPLALIATGTAGAARTRVTSDLPLLLVLVVAAVVVGYLVGVGIGYRAVGRRTGVLSGVSNVTHATTTRTIVRGLIAGQLASSIALAFVASSFASQWIELGQLNLTKRWSNVQSVAISLRSDRYSSIAASARLFDELTAALSAIPGVESVTLTSRLPGTENASTESLWLKGGTEASVPSARVTLVGANYFRAIGLPLVRGRTFSAEEVVRPRVSRAIVVDEWSAQALFGTEEAIGRQVSLGEPGTSPYTVVGVARVLRDPQLETPPAQVYLPAPGVAAGYLIIAGAVSSLDVNATLKRVLMKIDEDQAVGPAVPLGRSIDDQRSSFSDRARLLSVATGLTWCVAFLGVVGVLKSSVTAKQREFAIRSALGSSERQLCVRLVVEVLVMFMLGVVAGGTMAVLVGQSLAHYFPGMAAWNTGVFLTVCVTCAVATIVVAYLTARYNVRPNISELLRQ